MILYQFLCITDQAIVTQYFVQCNRLNLNANVECGHYSLGVFFEMGIMVYNAYKFYNNLSVVLDSKQRGTLKLVNPKPKN